MRIVLTLAVALLAGCSLFAPRHDEPSELRAHFVCTNGEELDVHFIATRHVAMLIRNDQSIELAQQPTASGFVYSNGPNTIRGKGNDLTVEIGRMVPLQCKTT
jgi:membrane-bound inhibitor of C-type lysozyme